ncbi:putative metal-dependent peptidase [Pseudomonas nitritireducens]|uniref:Putative metal-dependent peptidase n=1 Tax=Pseudomonas nitroreducens TaxID=46680 RepID=A0A7W7KFX6_PSENT|nr:VWA-like domain-containing protein [Pseudomonas nitritireducens]MBB4861553.1 putative metal-dependent peptidase [Pseudomonas nitritireducens]
MSSAIPNVKNMKTFKPVMAESDPEFKKKLSLLLYTLRQYSPFLAYMTQNMYIAGHTESVPTAAVSPKGVMVYNETFMKSLSTGELLFVMIHEALHPALDFWQRFSGLNHVMANKAHDYVINDIILSMSANMNYSKMDGTVKSLKIQKPKGALHKAEWAGWSGEAVYLELYGAVQKKAKEIEEERKKILADPERKAEYERLRHIQKELRNSMREGHKLLEKFNGRLREKAGTARRDAALERIERNQRELTELTDAIRDGNGSLGMTYGNEHHYDAHGAPVVNGESLPEPMYGARQPQGRGASAGYEAEAKEPRQDRLLKELSAKAIESFKDYMAAEERRIASEYDKVPNGTTREQHLEAYSNTLDQLVKDYVYRATQEEPEDQNDMAGPDQPGQESDEPQSKGNNPGQDDSSEPEQGKEESPENGDGNQPEQGDGAEGKNADGEPGDGTEPGDGNQPGEEAENGNDGSSESEGMGAPGEKGEQGKPQRARGETGDLFDDLSDDQEGADHGADGEEPGQDGDQQGKAGQKPGKGQEPGQNGTGQGQGGVEPGDGDREPGEGYDSDLDGNGGELGEDPAAGGNGGEPTDPSGQPAQRSGGGEGDGPISESDALENATDALENLSTAITDALTGQGNGMEGIDSDMASGTDPMSRGAFDEAMRKVLGEDGDEFDGDITMDCDDIPGNPFKNETPKETEQRNKSMLQKAVQADREENGGRGWGSMPGHARDLITTIIHPKPTFTQNIKREVGKYGRPTRSSRCVPDKRNTFMPLMGIKPGKLKDDAFIYILMDTSGSMKNPEDAKSIQLALGLIQSLATSKKLEIKVVMCDAGVSRVLNTREALKEIRERQFDAQGGAGSDFTPAFEYIWADMKKTQSGFKCPIICFTDGGITVPEKQPLGLRHQVMWVTRPLQQPPTKEWGEHFPMDDI